MRSAFAGHEPENASHSTASLQNKRAAKRLRLLDHDARAWRLRSWGSK